MLWDVKADREITAIPYREAFDTFMSRLKPEEIAAIKNALNKMVDGDEIHTSSWMPGPDWRGTPFQAIYEKAAKRNFELAAKCFGLLVWEVFMEHPDPWASGRYEKNGEPITGRTYFRIRPPR